MKRIVSAALSLAAVGLAIMASGALAYETTTLVSSAKNSLCVNPTATAGSVFVEPGATAPPYKPITEPHSGGPFPDTGAACEKGPANPIAGGTPGKPAFVYGSSLPSAQWVTPFANAEDFSNGAPRYYIYDTQFSVKCEPSSISLHGEMYADNVVGAFINGHPIGHDHLEETGKNFTAPAAPFGTNATADFVTGTNTLQFVVLDISESFTALDFTGKVTVTCSPTWLSNGKSIGASPKAQTLSWGTLSFSGPAIPTITCKKSDAGNIWNEGGVGLDETVLFDLYECSGAECPGARVTASGLPWHSELAEPSKGVLTDRTTGIVLTVGCGEAEATFTGELTPRFISKAGTTSPSYDEFNAESGTLTSKEGGTLTLTGKDYVRGFDEGDEVVTVKKGNGGPPPPEPEPHWYSNGVLITEGTAEPVTTTGVLTFKSRGGEASIKCKVQDHENILNPFGGTAGTDEMTKFQLVGCVHSTTGIAFCAAGETLELNAGALPWKTMLVAGPPIKDAIVGIEIRIECRNGSGVKKVVEVLHGSLTPSVGNSVLTFGAGSGELFNPSETIGTTVTGTDKLTGPPGDEVITAKNP